jgi:7,8-dihydropterin-6-yl-methyl-4-(beta-D-ribofuranosyl)aminobenzene 5'-phosphate synthase
LSYNNADMTITVIHDNNSHKKGLETAWGFSCVITGTEKTILFDTGPGQALLNNMEKLVIEPESIDCIVLSHIHSDHSGGLKYLLGRGAKLSVYLLKSFPKRFKENVQKHGAKVIEVEQPLKICEDVYSTGQLGNWIKEQSLIIRTDNELMVITGCAHPGIVKIIRTVKALHEGDIAFLMGGFHLEWAGQRKIENIISAFKQLGVHCVGPAHCSGNKAKRLFGRDFGKRCLNIGAGRVITAADL